MCLSIFAKKTPLSDPPKHLRNQFLPHGQSWSQILGQSLEGKDPNPTTSRKIIKLRVTTADGIWIFRCFSGFLTITKTSAIFVVAKSGKFEFGVTTYSWSKPISNGWLPPRLWLPRWLPPRWSLLPLEGLRPPPAPWPESYMVGRGGLMVNP